MTISRRTVLLSVLAACGGRQRPAIDATPFDAGPVTEYPPFTAIRFVGHGVAVVRDDRGVMALSILCTHQACVLDIASDGLSCGCHGSQFAMDGSLVRGPAKQPLPHYDVVVAGGRLVVDPSKVVAASTRLALG